jgi:hypothetical protein
MIPVPQYSSSAEMRAAYAGVKQRLFAERAPIALPKPKTVNYRVRPLWMRSNVFFNAHVIAWQLHKAAKAMSPVPLFIARWCEENGTTVPVMIGHCRLRKIAVLRHRLISEVHTKFQMSLPQVGRIFGGRDHATILNSIRRAAALAEAAQ